MKRTQLAAALLVLGLTACSDKDAANQSVQVQGMTQTVLDSLGQQLDVKYEVITNVPGAHCGEGKDRCFKAAIHLTHLKDFSASDWSIYFSQMRPVLNVDSEQFTITHVKGDLYRLSPTEKFQGFKAGQQISIPFVGDLWQLSESDGMPNYYLTSGELSPVVIASTKLHVDADTGMEVRPHVVPFERAEQYLRRESDKLKWSDAGDIYKANEQTALESAAVAPGIIPSPSSIFVAAGAAPVDLSAGISLNWDSRATQADKLAADAALQRLSVLGVPAADGGQPVSLSVDKGLEDESYRLVTGQDGIKIEAASGKGFNHALVSLASLLDTSNKTVAVVTVEDSPRYAYRGLHIDVSRNFHDKQQMLKLLDQMHAYKLNQLHLHMGDDEGWRLEIDGLPELTDIGSKRCHDLQERSCLLPQLGSGPEADVDVNGYYSKQDYVELLQYAAARQIRVIPSMDMPGHSRAAVKAMEARYHTFMEQGKEELARQYLLTDFEDKTLYSSIQYYDDNTLNVCMESTFVFIDKVIDEIAGLHKQAGLPLELYHIGADETAGAWVKSPACEAFVANNDQGVTSMDELGPYFIERISHILEQKGIEVAGWSDGMGHTRVEKMPAESQTHLWDTLASGGHKNAHKQVNYGWDAVLSSPDVLYFDFPYEATPKEHGYYWAQRRNNSQRIFNFMPDNLPANAEQWTDLEDLAYEADDTLKKDEKGNVLSAPIAKGKGFIGMQGQLWSETVRSDQMVDYMLFPRTLMLAERAWHKASWEVPYRHQGAVYNQSSGYFTPEMRAAQAQDWQRVANILGQKELAKLDIAGVEYRLPTPGAVVREGKLFANTIFPGLKVEYRSGEGEWQVYTPGTEVSLPVAVRSVAPDNNRRSRTVWVGQ
ncbi:carbohydate-binding domain-containing protein [Shewanella submarina]|uniref:beta-N-acetylhexosaminidase n=1 Tax=Shewanella submarina TaxID=2016376 RepID=A0ABV7GBQ9_9GAMM|nr:family 20 glycosylhydrolase [Shewanella submarina]MCL1036858.1 carbohydate-binding domain-containing protein [Shewanella submarina]